MIKYLTNFFRKQKEQNEAEKMLTSLFGKQKKEDYIKVKITKKQLSILKEAGRLCIYDGNVLNELLTK